MVLNIKIARYLIHMGATLFLVWLIYLIVNDKLGGDPLPALLHYLGKGALHLLLLSLAISPLAKWLGSGQLMRLRRPLGLWALFWATLHITTWITLDLQFDWTLILSELTKRTYIILGAIAWVLLVALGVTSIPRLRRQMGRYWVALHKLVYLVVLLIVIHYGWSVKSGWIIPALYLAVTLGLLLVRYRKLR